MSISNEDRPDTVDTGDEIFDPPDPIVLSNSLECPTKIEPGSQEPTPFKTIADTDPSDLLDTVTDSALFEPETKILDLPDENALAPSRLRFLLVCGLFLFIAAWSVLNVYDLFSPTSSMPELQIAWQNGRGVVIDVGPAFAGKLSEGDEIVSVNGDRIDERYKYRRAFRYLEAGHNYSLRVLRNGGTIDVDLPVVPLPVEYLLNTTLLGIVVPAVFFLTGLLVFLFHPNNKLTVLIAIAFALIASATTPYFDLMYPVDNLPLFLLWWSGYLISLLSSPVLLHFFLLFPRPSRFVRRFPSLSFLIYLVYVTRFYHRIAPLILRSREAKMN